MIKRILRWSALIAALMQTAGCGGGANISDLLPDAASNAQEQAASDLAGDTASQGSIGDRPTTGTGDAQGSWIEGSSPALVDDGPVAGRLRPPMNLSTVRYSETAGEIFWQAPADADGATRYVVMRDEQALDSVSALSYFTDSLSAGTPHLMSVYALDANGSRSAAATIRFNALIDIPPPVYAFELGLDRSRAALDEGNGEGTQFVVDVSPQGRETIDLVVQPRQPSDGSGILVELGKAVLDRDEPGTQVTFRLPVGMRPLQAQERYFDVIATSGDQRRQVEIVLDVKPVQAPDVYLLIGQSNMVGSSEYDAKDISPGGLDERNARIWQLNVAPNNFSLFAGLSDFIDESSTAMDPRYIEAEDPLHDPRNPIVAFKGGTSIGPGLSFAKAALADTTQRIYLVPAAWGATGFCDVMGDILAWNAEVSDNTSLGGSGLLDRALTRLRMTLRDTGGILRGILWHQGGADTNHQACADSYSDNLKKMVERLRREIPQDLRGETARGDNAALPFIVATQSKGRDDRGDYSIWPSTKHQVDAVHRNIAGLLPYADWVNTDDLVPPGYPCGSSSCVHFGAVANREIGRRYYQALQRIWSQ